MKPQRRRRLLAALLLVAGSGLAVAFVLLALEEGVDAFVPPDRIVDGSTPVGKRVRAGGMVQAGSVTRGDDLTVGFVLSDLKGHDFRVAYTGILPDLFREGQGILATGRLREDGVFVAEQVLAKHDENYHPPELADIGVPPPAPRGDGG
jgi:cytochrome c-type biogenesis protein CcmE